MNIKVISTCFNVDREIRFNSEFPQHCQNVVGDNLVVMLKEILEFEINHDAGVPLDILVVVNGDYNGELSDYHNKQTKNGTIIVDSRPNIGGSFGAYDYAVKNYNYNYYLFTEDDILVGGDLYYKKLIDCFESRDKIGFVALIGISGKPRHAHGGVGLSRRDVLYKIINKYGSLPHYDGGWNKKKVIRDGEVRFTNIITKNGYELVDFYSKREWDFKNKLCIPFFNYKKL